MTADGYARAVADLGLAPERAGQLLAHVARRNQAVTPQDPIACDVVRCAGHLIAARDGDLSAPLALARALAVSEHAAVGPALRALLEGLRGLRELDEDPGRALAVHAEVLIDALQAVARDAQRLAAALKESNR